MKRGTKRKLSLCEKVTITDFPEISDESRYDHYETHETDLHSIDILQVLLADRHGIRRNLHQKRISELLRIGVHKKHDPGSRKRYEIAFHRVKVVRRLVKVKRRHDLSARKTRNVNVHESRNLGPVVYGTRISENSRDLDYHRKVGLEIQ